LLFFSKSKPYLKDLISSGTVDIHSHLLPGIDDGAKNIDETIFLISKMKEIGFTKIITTPHIITNIWDNNENTIIDKHIETSGLTNGYVRATYNVEDLQGQMKAYSAYTTSIPLSMTFDIKLRADTLLDTFKIFQAVIQTFYKVFSFSVEFGGMRIPVQVGFPEQYQNDKQLEFSYSNTQKWIETNFSIAIETYYPQKDLETERFRGNLMQAGIRLQINVDDPIDPNNSSLF
jgi:hypothetical protein